ncbi:MAG TPA: CNP1-like family protein [Oxalicibacterium sp.]|nr:CNP1-like family protein [Oxalicibacterium sp.]
MRNIARAARDPQQRSTYLRFTRTLVSLILLSTMGVALAQSFDEDYDDESKPWQEIAVQLPPAPKDENLLSFYVSPTATQKFFVDAKSISVGSDDVVRYTLVSISQEGAKNVSYEGIRCATFEKKIYAIGQEDGSWARSRRNQWDGIVRGFANRQHAALAKDYFCENTTVAGKAENILYRLKNNKTLTDGLTR